MFSMIFAVFPNKKPRKAPAARRGEIQVHEFISWVLGSTAAVTQRKAPEKLEVRGEGRENGHRRGVKVWRFRLGDAEFFLKWSPKNSFFLFFLLFLKGITPAIWLF